MKNIGSFIIDSFQEYEGEHSLVLFYVGCNMRCKGCYNYNILSNTKELYSAKELIDKHITPLHTAVVFLGGEPTIHNSLIDDMRYAKSNGLKTKLYTNGLETNMYECMVKNDILDAISIDFKCLREVRENIGVDIDDDDYIDIIFEPAVIIGTQYGRTDIEIEYRTTRFPFLSERDISVMKYICNLHKVHGNIRHILQPYIETENNIK